MPIVRFVSLQGKTYRIEIGKVFLTDRNVQPRSRHQLINEYPMPIGMLVYFNSNWWIELRKCVSFNCRPPITVRQWWERWWCRQTFV